MSEAVRRLILMGFEAGRAGLDECDLNDIIAATERKIKIKEGKS